MPTQSEIRQRISAFVNESLEAGAVVHVSFVVTRMMSEIDDVDGGDADFYVACGADFVAKTAKQVIRGFEPKEENQGQQPTLFGFEYLQSGYPVERDGERVLVPTSQMTDAEFEAREQELLSMARGCIAHQKEMRGYRLARAAA